ncbi:MAG: DUF4440 domain-containing protein [Rudaea sp.]|uniref:nuclear transport factor 2 family protein n=1 Tax=Rudaea sp. TaxID=2136325 RepID=UPI0039E345A2
MKTVSAFFLSLLLASSVRANPPAGDVETAVRAADEAFWKTYNTCDLATTGDYFTADVEFYHDKGGLTKSRAALVESIRKNICGNPDQRVRREAVADSVKFYPMAGNRALLVGDHRFYVTEPGKPEYLTGQAKFDDLWEYVDGRWRMSRVFSYSHGGVAYVPPAAIELSAAALSRLAGRYTNRQGADFDVAVDGSHLKLTSDSFTLAIFALSPTQFFARERDLRFEFSAPKGGAVDRIFVRENGNMVDEVTRKPDALK